MMTRRLPLAVLVASLAWSVYAGAAPRGRGATPCRLPEHLDALAKEVEQTPLARIDRISLWDVTRLSGLPLGAYNPDCRRLVARWLGGDDARRRLVAAAYAHRFRFVVGEVRYHATPFAVFLHGGHFTGSTNPLVLEVSDARQQRWVERAGAEAHPVVLHSQATQLLLRRRRDRAILLLRNGAGLVARDDRLRRLALEVWTSLPRVELTSVECTVAGGALKRPSTKPDEQRRLRTVLSLARDPDWTAALKRAIAAGNEAVEVLRCASLAGLAPSFADKILARARKAGRYAHEDPVRLAGHAPGLLDLARIGPDGRIHYDHFTEGLGYATGAVPALVELARIAARRREMFWAGVGIVDTLGAIGTEDAVAAIFEVCGVAAGGGAEDGGPALSSVRLRAERVLEALGGPRLRQRLARLRRIRERRGEAARHRAPHPPPGERPDVTRRASDRSRAPGP